MQIEQTRSATVSVSEGAILLCGLVHLATSVSVSSADKTNHYWRHLAPALSFKTTARGNTIR